MIGISMGGRIAMALALQHPDLVKSLVLTSTFARQTGNTRSPLRLRLMQYLPWRMLRKYPQPRYAFARQLKASRSYDCSDRLDRISVPTLILHGRGDRLAHVELAEEMHAGIKGSKMVMFDGGHVFFMGMKDRFCEAIFNFLDNAAAL